MPSWRRWAPTCHDPFVPLDETFYPSIGRLRETPAYWAFRHFSGFVEAGALRLAVLESGADAVAFRNPGGRLVVALQNAGELPRTLTLGARGEVPEFEMPARGW